jgi:hypothetical protein
MTRSLTLLFLLLAFSSAQAADSLWQFIPQKEIKTEGKRKIIPQQYIVVKLNDSLFKILQSKVPGESSGEFVALPLPTPDGKFREFRLTESTTMAKELADKYPDLRTYKATEIGSPEISAKIDYVATGFHAMIMDGDNTYFIDPYSNKKTNYYICYYKRDYDKPVTQKLNESSEKKKCCKKKCRKK